jgi:hypothetical protein
MPEQRLSPLRFEVSEAFLEVLPTPWGSAERIVIGRRFGCSWMGKLYPSVSTDGAKANAPRPNRTSLPWEPCQRDPVRTAVASGIDIVGNHWVVILHHANHAVKLMVEHRGIESNDRNVPPAHIVGVQGAMSECWRSVSSDDSPVSENSHHADARLSAHHMCGRQHDISLDNQARRAFHEDKGPQPWVRGQYYVVVRTPYLGTALSMPSGRGRSNWLLRCLFSLPTPHDGQRGDAERSTKPATVPPAMSCPAESTSGA